MATHPSHREAIGEVFRHVIGHLTAGVGVITTSLDGVGHATTVSAMTSLSLDPPMLLVCLNTASDTQAAISVTQNFGVSILAEDQREVAVQFARKGSDKFEEPLFFRSATGTPHVIDALANIECEVTETARGGTHIVFLANVRWAVAQDGRRPLAYYRGTFGAFSEIG